MARRSAASSGEMARRLLICQLSCSTHSEQQGRLFENCLRFEKRFDTVGAKFTANAGILESAKRRLLIVKHAVDRDATGLDLRRHPASLQRTQLTGLDDDRTTSGEGGGKLSGKEKRVRVPRGNQAGNADRLHGDR